MRLVEGLRELGGAGVTELADYVDMPKSNVHNYLTTLREMDYVVKEQDQYHVGLRFLELGSHARDRKEIYRIAKPELETIADETGELVNLLVEEHGLGTYLARVRGEQAVEVEAHVGTRVYLHSTALGKAILAHLPESRVESIIDQHGLPERTDQTTTDRDELYDQLDTVRSRGYAIDDEERLKGLRCVAAPILSIDERVLGAISVSGPSQRLQGDRLEETLPERVLKAVNVIELNVTYS